jgi:hypothetical protein
MTKMFEIGSKWKYLDEPLTWELRGLVSISGTPMVEIMDTLTGDTIMYQQTEWEKLVTKKSFYPTKRSNNMKRSHLLNFINGVYNLGQVDAKSGSVRTSDDIETLFNDFVHETAWIEKTRASN